MHGLVQNLQEYYICVFKMASSIPIVLMIKRHELLGRKQKNWVIRFSAINVSTMYENGTSFHQNNPSVKYAKGWLRLDTAINHHIIYSTSEAAYSTLIRDNFCLINRAAKNVKQDHKKNQNWVRKNLQGTGNDEIFKVPLQQGLLPVSLPTAPISNKFYLQTTTLHDYISSTKYK